MTWGDEMERENRIKEVWIHCCEGQDTGIMSAVLETNRRTTDHSIKDHWKTVETWAGSRRG